MTDPEPGLIKTIIVFDGPWDMGSFLDGDLDTYLDHLRRKVPTTTKAHEGLFVSRIDWCLLQAVGEEGELIGWPRKEGKVGQLVLADTRVEPWATRRVEAAQWMEKQQLKYGGRPLVPNPAAPGQRIYYGPPLTAGPQWLPPEYQYPHRLEYQQRRQDLERERERWRAEQMLPTPPTPPNDQLRLGDPHPGTLVEVPVGAPLPQELHERWWRRQWQRPWNRLEEGD